MLCGPAACGWRPIRWAVGVASCGMCRKGMAAGKHEKSVLPAQCTQWGERDKQVVGAWAAVTVTTGWSHRRCGPSLSRNPQAAATADKKQLPPTPNAAVPSGDEDEAGDRDELRLRPSLPQSLPRLPLRPACPPELPTTRLSCCARPSQLQCAGACAGRRGRGRLNATPPCLPLPLKGNPTTCCLPTLLHNTHPNTCARSTSWPLLTPQRRVTGGCPGHRETSWMALASGCTFLLFTPACVAGGQGTAR
jgi:hypothetical protein